MILFSLLIFRETAAKNPRGTFAAEVNSARNLFKTRRQIVADHQLACQPLRCERRPTIGPCQLIDKEITRWIKIAYKFAVVVCKHHRVRAFPDGGSQID